MEVRLMNSPVEWTVPMTDNTQPLDENIVNSEHVMDADCPSAARRARLNQGVFT